MLIAIDYDDTFTADPDLWIRFIDWAKSRGHEVVCCTLRIYTPADKAELKSALPLGVPIYFCDHAWKRETMQRAGKKVNVWIDDMPEVIGKPVKTPMDCYA